ncbi:MAG TPA: family 43 glycosylhydrolase, partial [Chitinophagaceae bacterium]|nr:family 43 glycosylhydrolase [Chitinophagaceae bacterium]
MRKLIFTLPMLHKRSMRHFASLVKCLAILPAFFIQTLCAQKTKPHNPVIEGWYADPEGVIFENKYWIFPTYSAKYRQQVFLDAFSSTDMVTWKKHPKIIDTSIIKWAYMAMWAPSIVKKDNKYFLFFSANDIQSIARNGVKDDTL